MTDLLREKRQESSEIPTDFYNSMDLAKHNDAIVACYSVHKPQIMGLMKWFMHFRIFLLLITTIL
uniref:Uncharacterized protein n=1 Tax=Timema shepardi TaxID=629360 RepID=A0A7R9B2B5_TIMSH|nr:unnamed protein product [Timema shepardi]